jgi:hypothetical protein
MGDGYGIVDTPAVPVWITTDLMSNVPAPARTHKSDAYGTQSWIGRTGLDDGSGHEDVGA